jgi:outer membrane autotransporter protein
VPIHISSFLHYSSRLTAPILLAAGFILCASPTWAATRTWNGINADWDSVTNWSGGAKPATADTANIGIGIDPQISSTGNRVDTLNVGESGTPTLSFTGSGSLISRRAIFGNVAGNVGAGIMNGTGTFNSTSSFNLGGGGTGTFDLLAGTVTAATSTLGLNSTGTGTLSVSGANSVFTVTSTFLIGSAGQGTFNVTSGGRVTSGNTTIGQTASAVTSVATISDAGSTWTSGSMTVGAGSNGELRVTDGAVLNSSGGAIGTGTGTGFVEIDNSTWNANNVTGTAQIGVGSGGTGTLNILNGSTVQTSNRLNVGAGGFNGNGTMLIDNSTFTLLPQTAGVQANTTEIGRDNGTGVLTIQNGSTVVLNGLLQLGTRQTGGDGTMIVQGAGTTLTATSAFTVGQNGAGHFRLLDQAVVSTGSFTSAGAISGDTVIDNATLNITKNGVNSAVRLGLRATATMDIQNGGTLNAAGEDFEIASLAGSSGTLTIGGTGGTVNTAQVIGGTVDPTFAGAIVQGGTATVNFNHTNAAQTFTPRMRGFLTVNHRNTGQTTLTGDGDYTGDTNVISSTLHAGIINAFSENSAYHMMGGTLDLSNLDNEIGSLDGTTNVTLGSGTLTTGSLGSTAYSGVISGSGGLTKTGISIFRLDAAQTYTGLTTINRGLLLAGLEDAIDTSSGLTVNNGGIFGMGPFNQTINGDVLNNGLISFGALGHELTINGNLSGSNGLFFMETQVDAGIGDHITVTGTTSGNFLLQIRDLGGTPADPNQILEVVDTTDGTGTFAALGGTVDVGLYAYEVVRGDAIGQDPTNWYLGNTLDPSEGARAIVNTAAGLSNIWFTQLDNLHRRMGKQRLVDPSIHNYEVWGRGYAREIHAGASVSGRPFEEDINGADFGVDKIVSKQDGNIWLAGGFIGYGTAQRSFNDVGSHGETHTPYGGLYATWFGENNYYADFTTKLQHFSNKFDALDASGNLHHGEFDNWGLGGSAEVGRRLDITDGWLVQPQVQMQYVYMIGQDYVTKRSTNVRVEDDHIFQARMGIEAGKIIDDGDDSLWYPYGRISGVERFSFGGELRADDRSFDPNLDGPQLEYGIGAIRQMGNSQAYMAVTSSTGKAYQMPWAINLGFRHEF